MESVKHFFFPNYSRGSKILNLRTYELKILIQYSIRKYYFYSAELRYKLNFKGTFPGEFLRVLS